MQRRYNLFIGLEGRLKRIGYMRKFLEMNLTDEEAKALLASCKIIFKHTISNNRHLQFAVYDFVSHEMMKW